MKISPKKLKKIKKALAKLKFVEPKRHIKPIYDNTYFVAMEELEKL